MEEWIEVSLVPTEIDLEPDFVKNANYWNTNRIIWDTMGTLLRFLDIAYTYMASNICSFTES